MKPLRWTYRTFKTEIKVVFITLAVLITLPALTVAAMASAGIQAVSDTLAFFNPITHLVEVRNASGQVVAQMTAATTWPVKGNITTEFGQIHIPYQDRHTGIDIANPNMQIGDPVTTFMAGKVAQTPTHSTGYGKHVIVDHGHGITSIYGHLSEIRATPGQEVKPGDIIGLEGSTGTSTGPHLHFEIRVSGLPVNPRIFMVGQPK